MCHVVSQGSKFIAESSEHNLDIKSESPNNCAQKPNQNDSKPLKERKPRKERQPRKERVPRKRQSKTDSEEDGEDFIQ